MIDILLHFFRWCVLFSHPSDFTPVCTTELGRIAVHKEHFSKRNVKLLAHSVDDIKSHSDWVNVSFMFTFSVIMKCTWIQLNNNWFCLVFRIIYIYLHVTLLSWTLNILWMSSFWIQLIFYFFLSFSILL